MPKLKTKSYLKKRATVTATGKTGRITRVLNRSILMTTWWARLKYWHPMDYLNSGRLKWHV